MYRITWLFILCSAGAVACQGSSTSKETVAQVNQRAITLDAFEAKANRLAPIPGRDYSAMEQRRKLLDEMINQELLFQAAEKEGFIEQSDAIRTAIAKAYLKEKIGKERYQPTDEEIKKLFEEKRGKLEEIRARHILIKPTKPGDPQAEAEAEKRANALLNQLRNSKPKIDFNAVAKEKSEDEGTKRFGGDLRWFNRKKMAPEFTKAAFALEKKGDISDVVKTKFGYHIIQLTGDRRGFKRFAHALKWEISVKKQREKTQKLFDELRAKTSVKVFPEILAKAEITKGQKKGGARRMPSGHPDIQEMKPTPKKK